MPGSQAAVTIVPSGQTVTATGTDSGGVSVSTPATVAHILTVVGVKLNPAPTSAGNITVTYDSVDGGAYDFLLSSVDPSTTSATSYVFIPARPVFVELGSRITTNVANTDTSTIGITMIYEDM